MPALSPVEKERIIRRSFWDRQVNQAEIQRLLYLQLDLSEPVNAALYARVMQSSSWYTLLKIFDRKTLLKLLDDRVLKYIYPKELKEKYIYARRLLSE